MNIKFNIRVTRGSSHLSSLRPGTKSNPGIFDKIFRIEAPRRLCACV